MNISAQSSNQSCGADQVKSLIVRCRRGEKRAFTELFFLHKELVYRYIHKMLGHVERVDEVVQDVFIEVAKSLDLFKEDAKLSTWIYRITQNVCMQYLRDKHRKKNQILGLNAVEIDTIEDVRIPNAEQNLIRQRMTKEIRNALDSLDVKKRAIVVLHDMEGLSMKEIAQIVNVPLGTVQSRLLHARKKLKSVLVKQGVMYVVR